MAWDDNWIEFDQEASDNYWDNAEKQNHLLRPPEGGDPSTLSNAFSARPRPQQQQHKLNVDDYRVDQSAPVGYEAPQVAPVSISKPGSVKPVSRAFASSADSEGYDPATSEVDPSKESSADQLSQILGRDSKLFRRATSKALDVAGRRGLGNSSFAVGAALGETIDRAVPLAQQDAQTHFQNRRANLDATNRASEFGASARNRASEVNANLETAVSQFNAGEINRQNLQIMQNDFQQRIRQAELDFEAGRINAQQLADQRSALATESNALNRQAYEANVKLNHEGLRASIESMLIDINKYADIDKIMAQGTANTNTAIVQALGDIVSNPDLPVEALKTAELLYKKYGLLANNEYTTAIDTALNGGVTTIDVSTSASAPAYTPQFTQQNGQWILNAPEGTPAGQPPPDSALAEIQGGWIISYNGERWQKKGNRWHKV